MEIVSERPVSATEVLESLKDRDDLKPRQQNALEYLRKHVAVKDLDTLEELRTELEELNGFREEHINKIIETLPATDIEVNSLFAKERVKLEDSDVEKIVEFSRSLTGS